MVFAQESAPSEADAILDDLFTEDSLSVENMIEKLKKQDFLYINTLYNNKTLFSGRDFGVDQYSFFPSISYIDANNFFLNASSGYYSGVSPNWDFVTFSGGYSKYLNKKKSFLATGVYSYTAFTNDVANLNDQRASLSLSYRNKWFRNSMSGGYLFGGTAAYYLSNNSYFSIDILDGKTLDITVEPRIGVFWGNQTVTELVSVGFNRFQEINKNIFQVLNSELSIPIELDFGNWDIELDYTFSFPNAIPNEESVENSGFISVSFGYLLGL